MNNNTRKLIKELIYKYTLSLEIIAELLSVLKDDNILKRIPKNTRLKLAKLMLTIQDNIGDRINDNGT